MEAALLRLEYKGKHADLDAAFAQLRQYALALENPALLIVSDMARFRIRTQLDQQRERKARVHAGRSRRRDRSRQAQVGDVRSRPSASGRDAAVANRTGGAVLRDARAVAPERGHDPQEVAHFVNRLVFCMFADDVGLLPGHMFTEMLGEALRIPEQFTDLAGDLFSAMASGGRIGFKKIDWFNGGLFDDATALPLEKADIETVLAASNLDWSEIDPSILGTLFERGLDPGKRAQLGAHYTDRDKIMLIVEPVVIRPWLASGKPRRPRSLPSWTARARLSHRPRARSGRTRPSGGTGRS